jgi:hypothetical protein
METTQFAPMELKNFFVGPHQQKNFRSDVQKFLENRSDGRKR